MDALILTS